VFNAQRVSAATVLSLTPRFSEVRNTCQKPLKRFAALKCRRHLAEARYLFSANGAILIQAWGNAPGFRQKFTSADSAIHLRVFFGKYGVEFDERYEWD